MGTITWALTMARSGLCWNDGCTGGLGFWGANGHDGIWHIALSESLSKGSFLMPIFSGQGIENYHIGFDLLLALFHKISFIPIPNLYFQVIPPVLAFLVGLLTYKFVLLWTRSEKASLWSTFFVYFGGSFGWLVSLIRGQGWGGESMFWSMQSVSTLINPPFALSLVFLLAGLVLLLKLDEKFSRWIFLLCVLSFGILIEIKVYAGILALGGLMVAGVYSLIIERKSLIIKVFFTALIISFAIYIPFNKLSGSLIAWQPFWFLESMVGASDRFYAPKLAEAMLAYKSQPVIGKFVLAYGLTFVLFIVGNMGTRILFLLRKIRLNDKVEILIYPIIAAGIIIPTLFVQEGTPWNTIQFFYYSLFFTSILSGVVIGKWTKSSRLSAFIKTLVILLTIPTTIFTLKDVYLTEKPPAVLPATETEALNFISRQPDGVVLTYPFDEVKSKNAVSPSPLSEYVTTAYVSAFSGKQVFLEDEMNLDIMQYPWRERRSLVGNFLNTLDIDSAKTFLEENNIKYVYWLKDQHARIGDKELNMTLIFSNSDVTVFKVN